MDSLSERVLYRDANLLVLNKPTGIPVHRGPSGKPALEDGFHTLTFGLRHVPIAAHRLDHDTSGCLVLARHPKARSRLGRLFSNGRIRKIYWAICEGVPPGPSGRIDLPLFKENSAAGWHIVVDQRRGQPAVTDWTLLVRGDDLAWLELHPLTGRTHQIRVHLAAIGLPVRGDRAYGGSPGCTLLHARRIEIPYWEGRPAVVVEAPPEAEFLAAQQCMVTERQPT